VRTRTWQIAYAHVFPAEALEAMTPEPWVERWQALLASPRPQAHVLVGEHNSEVVGFAHIGPTQDERLQGLGELFAIYVLPEAWGLGVGQALMAETLNRLRLDGFEGAILWVLEDNPRTRRFYELAGWYADGGAKDEEWLGTSVREIRYCIALKSGS
jgi:GNAT superfamily N-acetyltransferase